MTFQLAILYFLLFALALVGPLALYFAVYETKASDWVRILNLGAATVVLGLFLWLAGPTFMAAMLMGLFNPVPYMAGAMGFAYMALFIGGIVQLFRGRLITV